MKNKFRLLDLFCGAGGCSMGYYRAGFEVVGVDIKPQPHYPFEFVQADAMIFPLDGFDFIHASPPCQFYTSMLNHGIGDRSSHPDLVEVVRSRLVETRKPYIIENVLGAPLQKSFLLCGAMFGLRVYRHRIFESNLFFCFSEPAHPKHRVKTSKASKIPRYGENWCPVGKFGHWEEAGQAMGIAWMKSDREIAQAIPPVYTEWIGQQWMDMFHNTRPSSNINQPGAVLPFGKITNF